jgi:hypothetical protein
VGFSGLLLSLSISSKISLDQPVARDRIAGIIVPAIALERILSHAVDRLFRGNNSAVVSC